VQFVDRGDHRADQAPGRRWGGCAEHDQAATGGVPMPAARALARVGRMSSAPIHLLGALEPRSSEPAEGLLGSVPDEESTDHRARESSDIRETSSMLDAWSRTQVRGNRNASSSAVVSAAERVSSVRRPHRPCAPR
jgi:hypothetical protein